MIHDMILENSLDVMMGEMKEERRGETKGEMSREETRYAMKETSGETPEEKTNTTTISLAIAEKMPDMRRGETWRKNEMIDTSAQERTNMEHMSTVVKMLWNST
jgi:hypothetical protein